MEIMHDRDKLEYDYNGYRFDYMTVEKMNVDMYLDLCQDDDRPYEEFRAENTEYALCYMFESLGYMDIVDIYENAPTWFEQLADNMYYSEDYTGDYPTDTEVLDYYNGISFTSGDFVS